MKITIHVDNPKCRRWWFRPLQQDLVPTFRYDRVAKSGAGLRDEFASLGDIPGTFVTLDVPGLEHNRPDYEKATATVGSLIDDEKWEEIKKVWAESKGDIPLGNIGSRPKTETHELHDADAVATWLYWMRRGVETGHVTLAAGQLPTTKQCQMLGTVNLYDTYGFEAKKDSPSVGTLPKLDSESSRQPVGAGAGDAGRPPA